MPKEIYDEDFYCPKCKKNPSKSTAMTTEYSMYRLDLPYFLCGDCRLCSYDKQLIGQVIQRWDKHSHATSHTPYEEIYRSSIKLLEELLEYYVSRVGYRIAKFKLKKT